MQFLDPVSYKKLKKKTGKLYGGGIQLGGETAESTLERGEERCRRIQFEGEMVHRCETYLDPGAGASWQMEGDALNYYMQDTTCSRLVP